MKINHFCNASYLIISLLFFSQCTQIETKNITKDILEFNKDSIIKERLSKHKDFGIAENFYSINQDSALNYYKRTLKREIEQEEKLYVLNMIGLCKYVLGEYEEAKKYLRMAEELFPDCVEYLKNTIDTYVIFGYVYKVEMKSDSALLYYDNALKKIEDRLGNKNIFFQKVILKKGDIYKDNLLDYSTAGDIYKEALKIAESLSEEYPDEYIDNLYNLSIIYRFKGDYQRALFYAQKVLSYAKIVDNIYKIEVGNSTVGNIYRANENFDLAIAHIKEAIDYNKNEYLLSTYYNNLSVIYEETNQFDSALYYCEKASKLLLLYPNNVESGNNYETYGRVYKKTGEQKNALYHYRSSLNLRKQSLGLINEKVSTAYFLIGEYYLDNGSVDSALYYFQQSLIAGAKNYTDIDWNNNPDLYQVQDNLNLEHTLHGKSDALYSLYKTDTTEIIYLKASLDCLKLGDALIDYSWRSYSYEDSKLYLEGFVYELYEKAVKIAFELYNITKDEIFIKDAFNFFEKNKYKYLYDNLNSKIALNKVDVNEGLIQSIKDIEYVIRFYSRKKLADPTNPEYDTKIFEFVLKKEQVENRIKTEYPDYDKVKSGKTYKDLSDLNRLLKNNNTVVLQFFDGGNVLYAITANGTTTSMNIIHKNKPFKESIRNILLLQSAYGVDQTNAYVDYINYSRSAYHLYKVLIKKQLYGLVGEEVQNLIVVPDGDLAQFNFEALITEMPDTTKIDYDLDYLIYDYNISYAYSSNILLSESLNKKKRNRKMLAFSYGTGSIDEVSHKQLIGANKEVSLLSKFARGRFFYNKKATETNFKKYADKFGIIHLALHGNADIINNDNTMLTFRKENDDSNDGYLFAEELYNLNLSPQLVVLSSCETGIGKFYKGEGVYSMARAFSYIGCPSLVSTLWSISDVYSADIMSEFYKSLSDNIPFNSSLRRAKLKYLSNSGQRSSHPRNWASYIALGKSEYLGIKKSLPIYLYFIFGAFLIVVIGIIAKRTKLTMFKQNGPKV